MKLAFSSEDLKRLEVISEKDLYLLNTALNIATSNVKRPCLADDQLIYQLVVLTETAAKEVACRKRWSPKPSTGRYNVNGITYDIPEYRKWLIETNPGYTPGPFSYFSVLKHFSFGEKVLDLMDE